MGHPSRAYEATRECVPEGLVREDQRMHRNRLVRWCGVLAIAGAIVQPQARCESPVEPSSAPSRAILWRDPGDIRLRNLYYGPGGRKDQPEELLTFLKED